MKNTKPDSGSFTPGPWEYHNHTDRVGTSSLCGGFTQGECVFIAYRKDPINLPDAYLLEAAPDLYEALELALPCVHYALTQMKWGNEAEKAVYSQCVAVLAEARGES